MTGAAAAIEPLVVAWVALVGASVGSFLNVVIARLPAGESLLRPRSRCPGCLTPIAWYDNVPVLSWLVLRGRCRACRAPISIRYPVVEVLGAAAALGAWARHGLTPAAAAELALVASLLALAAIDLDTWLLPNAITWPLLAAGLALGAAGLGPAADLRAAVYGAGLGFAAFALVSVVGERLLRREALGFGDVWLLAALGAWFGVRPLLPIVMLASVQGSLVGLALIALGRGEPGPGAAPSPPADPAPVAEAPPDADAGAAHASPDAVPAPPLADRSEEDWVPPRHAVPFGPFLVAGALEWLYLGRWLADHFPLLGVFR